jgi:hypothetical protein
LRATIGPPGVVATKLGSSSKTARASAGVMNVLISWIAAGSVTVKLST